MCRIDRDPAGPSLLVGMTLNPLAWLRYTILAFVVAGLLLASAAGAVDTGKIHPHSKTGRAITSVTAPFVAPVRRTVTVGGGGHGLSTATWFGVMAVITGAFAASFFEWLLFPTRGIGLAAAAPARRSIAIAVTVTFAVILGFVIAGMWGALAGAPRSALWMAPFSLPTGWAVDRLQGGSVPRVALIGLAAGALYGALRFGRWFFVRAT